MAEGQDGLGRWPISCELPVQWGDMDVMNHVNHTVFLKWMETTRIHYFVACDFLDLFEEEGVGPILAGIKVDYLKPVVFPDTVTIHTTITSIGTSSFQMGYRLTSAALDGETVATAIASAVVFDYNANRSTPMPDSLRVKILELEASGSG